MPTVDSVKWCSLCKHGNCERTEWPCVGCTRARQVKDRWQPRDREIANMVRRIRRKHNAPAGARAARRIGPVVGKKDE